MTHSGPAAPWRSRISKCGGRVSARSSTSGSCGGIFSAAGSDVALSAIEGVLMIPAVVGAETTVEAGKIVPYDTVPAYSLFFDRV